MRRLSLSPLTSPRGNGSQLNAFLTPAGTVRERNSDLLDLKTVRPSASLARHLQCRNVQARNCKSKDLTNILYNTLLLAQSVYHKH